MQFWLMSRNSSEPSIAIESPLETEEKGTESVVAGDPECKQCVRGPPGICCWDFCQDDGYCPEWVIEKSDMMIGGFKKTNKRGIGATI